MVKTESSDAQIAVREPNKRELAAMRRKQKKAREEAIKRVQEKDRDTFKPIYNGKILSIRKTPFYAVVKEMTGTDYGPAFPISYAMTLTGDYLGDPKTAYRLVHKYRIYHFEKTEPTHSVCSIGYNPVLGRWFGWSHRAISKFRTKREAVAFAKSVS